MYTWYLEKPTAVPLVLTTGTPTPILTIYYQLAYLASLGPPRPRGLLPVGVPSSLCPRGTSLFSFYCRVTELQWLTNGRNLYVRLIQPPLMNSLFSYSQTLSRL